MDSRKKPRHAAPAPKAAPRPASPSAPAGPGFWQRHWAPALVLLLLPFVLYHAAIGYGYVLDDAMVLSQNKFVQQGSKGIGQIFATESFTGYLGTQQNLVQGARYRPLSIATFAMEQELFGASPSISHFLNILLYSLTALLLFRLLSLLMPPPPGRAWYAGVPFLAALLFAFHPVHTEVVANIKGRDEILALLLSLLATWYAVRHAQQGKLHQLLLAPVAFLLALFAKENALTFLAVIPLVLHLLVGVPLRKQLLSLAPIGMAALLFVAVRQNVIGYLLDSGQAITSIMNNPFADAQGSEKPATISLTLGWYIKLLFYPHPLTHDYYPYHVPLVPWSDWRAWGSLLLNLGLLGLAVWQWRRAKVVSFGILYYFATLSMASNIVFPVGTFMNERFLYMPSVGFCVLLAWLALEKLPALLRLGATPAKALGLGLLGLFLAGFALRTYTRVPDWENAHTLESAAVKVSVNSCRSNQFYAYSLYEKSLTEKDPVKQKALYDEALPYVTKSLEIYPTYTEALTCKSGILAGYYQQDGHVQPLLDWFEHVLRTQPVPFVDQYLNYLVNTQRHPVELQIFLQKVLRFFTKEKADPAAAKKYLEMWARIDPGNPAYLEARAAIEAGR